MACCFLAHCHLTGIRCHGGKQNWKATHTFKRAAGNADVEGSILWFSVWFANFRIKNMTNYSNSVPGIGTKQALWMKYRKIVNLKCFLYNLKWERNQGGPVGHLTARRFLDWFFDGESVWSWHVFQIFCCVLPYSKAMWVIYIQGVPALTQALSPPPQPSNG